MLKYEFHMKEYLFLFIYLFYKASSSSMPASSKTGIEAEHHPSKIDTISFC